VNLSAGERRAVEVRPHIDLDDDTTLVVRTDYTDEDAWRTVVALLDAEHPIGSMPVNHFVDDPAWGGATVDEILAVAPEAGGVVFVADAATMCAPYPLIAANAVTRDECEDDEEFAYEMSAGREFRVLPGGVADVYANLSIANSDFPDFAFQAQDDPDGYYRGLAATERGAAALAAMRDLLRQRAEG
jgi:hypothetical protein